MSSGAVIERVPTLDPAAFAHCDFSFDPTGGAYPFDTALSSPLSSDRRMLAVASIDGQVAGYIACRCDGDAAEVRRLEIDRAFRRGGLGRRLLDEARAWAGEHGLSALRLETLADNPDAGRFFGLYGFVLTQDAGTLRWHLPLGG